MTYKYTISKPTYNICPLIPRNLVNEILVSLGGQDIWFSPIRVSSTITPKIY